MKHAISKHLGLIFGATYLCGVILYTIGFWEGASGNIFTSLLRASIASLEMFAMHSELIEVSEPLKEGSVLYMALFASVHFIAAALTLVLFIELFGKRLVSRLLAWHMCGKGHEREKLIIIDGTDDNCISLALSIPKDESTKIVFIKGVVDIDIKKISVVGAIFEGMRNKKFSVIDSLGTILCTNLQLSTSIVTDKGWIGRRVLKLIGCYQSTEIFFLEWNSKANADAAYLLGNSLDPGLNVKIYAGVNVSKQHADRLVGCPYVIPVNRSQLVVDDLFAATPILKEGAGRKTLILGFGHTAQTCLKQLVGNGFTDIDVIDPASAGKSEEFLCFNPELRKVAGLNFYSHEFQSNAFWKYVEENFAGIDNVLIFSQDESENYDRAVKLLRYAKLTRTNLDDFRIYVMEQGLQPGNSEQHIHPFGRQNAIYNYAKF